MFYLSNHNNYTPNIARRRTRQTEIIKTLYIAYKFVLDNL